jgi:hypothetical protein
MNYIELPPLQQITLAESNGWKLLERRHYESHTKYTFSYFRLYCPCSSMVWNSNTTASVGNMCNEHYLNNAPENLLITLRML